MAPHSSLTEHLSLCLNVLCGRVNQPGDTVAFGPYFLFPPTPKRAQVIAAHRPRRRGPPGSADLHGYHGEMPTTTLAEEILDTGRGSDPGPDRQRRQPGGGVARPGPDPGRARGPRAARRHRPPHDRHRRAGPLRDRARRSASNDPTCPTSWTAGSRRHTPTTPTPSSNRRATSSTEWEFYWEIAERLDVEIELPGGPMPRGGAPTRARSSTSRTATGACRSTRCAPTVGSSTRTRRCVVTPAEVEPECRRPLPGRVRRYRRRARRGGRGVAPGPRCSSGFDAERFPFRLTSRRLKSVLNSLGPELPEPGQEGHHQQGVHEPRRLRRPRPRRRQPGGDHLAPQHHRRGVRTGRRHPSGRGVDGRTRGARGRSPTRRSATSAHPPTAWSPPRTATTGSPAWRSSQPSPSPSAW